MIVKLEYFYLALGLMLLVIALMSLRDRHNPRRHSTALFWGLYALIYLAGEYMAPAAVGALMIVMALIAGFGGVSLGRYQVPPEDERRASAQRLGNRLFIPALIIPLTTMLGATLLKDFKFGQVYLLDQKSLTLVSLGCGALLAVVAACWLTRSTPLQAMREARRLIDSIGWAVVLPHMLAVLGLLFIEAGVGKAVAHVATTYINMDLRLTAVAVYCVGMALFTIVMGNAFAAFPVMVGGVGIPILVGVYHANPALMAAIGMFSGYCGTLMTPMAANFNIVPALLLELPDRNSVVKVQIATALPLLLVNILLLYFLMYQ
ncbi:putative membrane protein [Oxalobacteraceae bacterium GrIS 1.11]